MEEYYEDEEPDEYKEMESQYEQFEWYLKELRATLVKNEYKLRNTTVGKKE